MTNYSPPIKRAAIPLLLLFWSSCLLIRASAYQVTSIPPLLDVPTFSLSTTGNDSTSLPSTMNVLTYVSPVAIKPNRMWSISLYKGTLSHENFAKEKRGILQLLRPEHALCKGEGDGEAPGTLIRILGGSSGRDVNKEALCAKLGYPWQYLNSNKGVGWPKVLPNCLYYLKLELVGEMIDCGSHDVAICRVVDMVSEDDVTSGAELDYVSTRALRGMDVITEFGRIKE